MQLGYLHFEVSDLPRWHTLLTQVLGVVPVGEGRYTNDQHQWRFQLSEGPANDLVAVGWEYPPDALAATLERLRIAGVPFWEADPASRSAQQRFCLQDPAGVPLELVTGLALREEPFVSPVVRSGFVADAQGLGHLVVTAPDPAVSRAFYERLGARHSDDVVCQFYGVDVSLSFFHVNPRHHSLAFGGAQRKRLHHFMVEARVMDEVGLAFDRALRHNVPIMQTIGRHPNDRMFSFYARTPSGFQFEFGWGGREVDDATWQPQVYDRISEWGHHPPQVVFAPKREQAGG